MLLIACSQRRSLITLSSSSERSELYLSPPRAHIVEMAGGGILCFTEADLNHSLLQCRRHMVALPVRW